MGYSPMKYRIAHSTFRRRLHEFSGGISLTLQCVVGICNELSKAENYDLASFSATRQDIDA